MAKVSWREASLYERSIVTKIRLLKDAPEEGFAEQIQVTMAVALLVDSAAMNSGIAVRVLSMLLTDRPHRRQRSLHENSKPANTHQERGFKNREPSAERLDFQECGETA